MTEQDLTAHHLRDVGSEGGSLLEARQLLTQLRRLDIRLSAYGGRLRVNAPKGALTAEVREALSAHKAAILELLAAAPAERGTDGHVLASAQQGLWFVEQLAPQTSTYNIPRAFRLIGRLECEALEAGLREIVGRHEVLRSRFAEVDGEPRAFVAPSLPFSLPLVDLDGRVHGPREAEAIRLAHEESRRPFDLVRGPLFRAVLIRLGAEDHILSLTWHHIVADGWSVGVFLRELAALYPSRLKQREPAVGALPMQYYDWALREQAWLRTPAYDRQLDYWRARLEGAPTVLELPTDRPRRVVQPRKGAWHPVEIEPALLDRLQTLRHRERVSLFMTLVAAFNVLLLRYTGQTDLLVGIPTANRTSTQTEGLIGLFVNTLVLRTDCAGDPSFRELLRRVRDAALEAYAHPDLPFDRLVDVLHPARHMSRSPVVQVMFAMHDASVAALTLPGLMVRAIDVHPGTARFDLTVDARGWPGGLRLDIEYDPELFDAATVARLSGHFRTLLAGAVMNPTARLSALPLLTGAERHRTLVTWNATDRAYPDDLTVHQLLEAQARRTPDAIAAAIGSESITYRSLHERANQVAHRLRAVGVGPDIRVGVCTERSLDLLVAVLAVLKAGGAYLPLDPAFPRERLRFMLQDADVRVLVIQERFSAMLSSHRAAVLSLDTPCDGLRQACHDHPAPVGSANDLAYVIYTSGSTGQPNGVLISHRAAVNFLMAMREQPGLTAADVLVAVTTLSFDIAALELFLPLMVGARVVLADRQTTVDGRRLAALLERSGATVMQATPATWRLLLASGWRGRPGLRILSGGEVLSRPLATALRNRGASLWNLYGPTETTVWSTLEEVQDEPGSVLIGRPIANTRVYVLDPHGHPTPVGVPGELYIGGDGVARGYLNRPELTAQRFLLDPFSKWPGARMYRTGDRARFRVDGRLEYLGRMDDQVKIGGIRIELAEVEAALAAHPEIRQAAVVARDDRSGERALAAYVTSTPADSPEVSELRAFLAERLPKYMIPSTFTVLPELPLTSSGKIDRRRLPAPSAVPAPSRRRVVSPRDETDLRLVNIWERVLGTAPIGITDDFFELGGHSLLAVRLLFEIEHAFGQRPELSLLFERGSVAAVADALRVAKTEAGELKSLVAFRRAGRNVPIFAVHAGAGDLLFYHGLATALGDDQPFYGVQPPAGLDGVRAPYAPYGTIEALAGYYVSEVRRLRPRGPYVLAGACAGGPIALEMAQRLQAAGETVGPLLIFDGRLGGRESLADRGRRHWRAITGLNGRQRIAYVTSRLPGFGRWRHARKRLRLQAIRAIYHALGKPVPQETIHALFLQVSDALTRRYRPRPFAGSVLLFRAGAQPPNASAVPEVDPTLGWRSIADVVVIDMPGAHLDALAGASAAEVARVIRNHLEGSLGGGDARTGSSGD